MLPYISNIYHMYGFNAKTRVGKTNNVCYLETSTSKMFEFFAGPNIFIRSLPVIFFKNLPLSNRQTLLYVELPFRGSI